MLEAEMNEDALFAMLNPPPAFADDEICLETFKNLTERGALFNTDVPVWWSQKELPFIYNQDSIYCWIKYLTTRFYSNDTFS